MSIAEWEEKILTQGTNKLDESGDHHLANQERAAEGLVKPTELEFKEGVGPAKTPVTLSKEDHVKGFYITSSSKINAVVGGSSSARFRVSGVPTIRTDIAPPRIRRFGDRNNYGDGSDAYGLLCPSVFSQKMVYESDFLKPRSKEEISQILHNMDVDISSENFDQLWDVALKSHPRGKVSVETIRNALARMPIAQTSYLER
uniref:EFHB C-terminal EF-hand domain-containing protein n=1 Tax=Leptobrachium leishanense TaxID=445787 RepID=A0A8C5N3S0_9ANUR